MIKKISAFALAGTLVLLPAAPAFANSYGTGFGNTSEYDMGYYSEAYGDTGSYDYGQNRTYDLNRADTGATRGTGTSQGAVGQGTAGQRTSNNMRGGTGVQSQAPGFENILPQNLNVRSSDLVGQLKITPDTYIVQDGSSLWLIMGSIKAKLDVLVYIDPENAGRNTQENQSGSSGTENTGTTEKTDTTDKNNLGIPVIR